jgi:hypothetical protein
VVSAAPAIDTVEVLRAIDRSGWDLAATIALGVAAAAIVVLLLLALQERGPGRIVWVVSMMATGAELVFQVVGAGVSVSILLQPRGLAALARLIVLAAMLVIEVAPARSNTMTVAGGRRFAMVGLSLVALATVPLAMPGAGAPGGIVHALGLTLGLTATLTVLHLLAARLRVPATAGTLVLVLAAGSLTGVLATPDRDIDHHTERVVVGGVAFDLTVAPVRPGRNELHLYAWGGDGEPHPLSRVDALVASPSGSTTSEMYAVTPNHHLSYQLMLPDPGPWELELSAHRDGGEPLILRTTLETP